nr:mrna decapping complex subunit 2 [Quercus suber]
MGGTTNMSLPDHLDDLTVRFLLNLPASELSSVPRLCFQVEEAQWFYEDFVRPAAAAAGNPLPSLTLRQFCLALFQHCPMLKGFSDAMHIAAYEEFLAYKVRVPVRGAILMSEDMERLVLVKGWKKGASWSFPRGKINKNEADLDCAIREVYEETGYDVRQAGLVPEHESEVKAIDVTMREQHIKLFVFRGVKEDTYFEPKTRKEISKIQWYNVKDLPGFKRQKNADAQHANKFYMVAPFLSHLKKWIKEQRKNDIRLSKTVMTVPAGIHTEDEDMTDTAIDKAEELRRLLMVPASHPGDEQRPTQQLPLHSQPNPAPQSQTNDLLALLKGRGQAVSNPQMPFDQISVGVPPEPPAPQPQLARQLPSQHLSSLPQAAYPLNNSRQTHGERFTERQGGYEQNSSGFPPHAPYVPWAPMQPTHVVPQHDILAQMNLQSPPTHRHEYINNTQAPLGAPLRSPMQTNVPQQMFMPDPRAPNQGPSQQYALQQFNENRDQQIPGQPQQSWVLGQSAPSTVGPQGLHGAIAAGPSAPKPENLPVPKMNAHAMKLLGAFKSPMQVNKSANDRQAVPGVKQASAQQDALLGLLKQSEQVNNAAPTKETIAEEAEKLADPLTLQRRQSALNEITRTLPAMKIKSPPPGSPRSSFQKSERPKPSSNTVMSHKGTTDGNVSAKKPDKDNIGKTQQGSKTILQRPGSAGPLPPPQIAPPRLHHTTSPKGRTQSAAIKPGKQTSKDARTSGAAQSKPFTILARPVSRPGSGSGSGLETDKVRSPAHIPHSVVDTANSLYGQQEVQTSMPSSSKDVIDKHASTETGIDRGALNEDKKDQLLALFGRKDRLSQMVSSPAATPSQSPAISAVPRHGSGVGSHNLKLDSPGINQPAHLPGPGPGPAAATTATSHEIPSAVVNTDATKQKSLLDLFAKSSSTPTLVRASSSGAQPPQKDFLDASLWSSSAAPSSPFALTDSARNLATSFSVEGTTPQPHRRPSANHPFSDVFGPPSTSSRSGSLAFARDVSSPVGSAAGRNTGASTPTLTSMTTPNETKGFLLNYLNGVVQKEGGKANAAKR